MPVTPRLSSATLATTRAATPAYDRTATTPGVVHVGLGNFARAHVARYCDDLLAAGHGDTAVVGVSLRSGATTAALASQDGLYTLTETDGRYVHDRIVGSVTALCHGADAAVAAIAAPATRAVTLTITEKAYAIGSGSMTTAADVIVAGLARRRDAGLAPLPVVSCDNLDDNGRVTAGVVVATAEAVDADLAAWIDAGVSFPATVVDRIVPATTDDDRRSVASRLAHRDDAPVRAEPHCRWVIERCSGLPAWDLVGATVVDDVGPWQRHKLWAVNGPHSALAYLGGLAGMETIDQAVRDPDLAGFVAALVDDVTPLLDPAVGPKVDAVHTMGRFANPALGHRCAQVAADGSRKLRQRVLDVIVRRRSVGLDVERHALVMAAWILWVTRAAHGGHPLVDPDAETLVDTVRSARDLTSRVAALLSAPAFVRCGVADDPVVVDAVVRAVELVDRVGVTAAARRLR